MGVAIKRLPQFQGYGDRIVANNFYIRFHSKWRKGCRFTFCIGLKNTEHCSSYKIYIDFDWWYSFWYLGLWTERLGLKVLVCTTQSIFNKSSLYNDLSLLLFVVYLVMSLRNLYWIFLKLPYMLCSWIDGRRLRVMN